ncbi:hypothetical protein GCM10010495_21550 [Kitasatospora herbaricolor]|uniref:hypothetical protein n=1 Tax=Kitasatospora herbaricolor TaxID=68217 RepID=UPI00174B39C2|nr:hypothetical protein [Kitasatospora herbaricolor]MDQ0310635.1 hypothetical protein [Kitasatospora herbaricolor]GGV08546.1 hypothetical protein GCM10010495_21550 [Kitasatospora herbaricolor]
MGVPPGRRLGWGYLPAGGWGRSTSHDWITRARKRDLVRKRRAHARAGIPVHVIVDDLDGDGHVTVLTDPHPDRATYEAEIRVPYGTEVTVPEGPAKGFVIGVAITGEPRRA